MASDEITGISCPVPQVSNEKITLGHGSGGLLTHELITKIFLKEFDNDYLNMSHDGAVFISGTQKLAFTTDTFVVNPLFFPGGNIGDLAVNGTVNDLAMCGAVPMFLSAGFIIEEGFSQEDLKKIVHSMKAAAVNCGVSIITGDTKVVEKGKGDKLFINTSGIGLVQDGIDISPKRIAPGDKIILSGSIADHGIAVLAARENLNFRTEVHSDTAAVHDIINKLLQVCKDVHVLRDPTRGGVAGTLNELARSGQVSIFIDEVKVKVKEEVNSACEILGFDPLYVANEGKFICILPGSEAEEALKVIRSFKYGNDAEIIGDVRAENPGRVILHTRLGTKRVLEMLSGDQLPRIC
jgi:hydrogenase expression/formation protein HypE